jgi:hypothetical protein
MEPVPRYFLFVGRNANSVAHVLERELAPAPVAMTATTSSNAAIAAIRAGNIPFDALFVDVDQLDAPADTFSRRVRELSDIPLIQITIDPQPNWAALVKGSVVPRPKPSSKPPTPARPRLFAEDACALLAHDVKNCLYAASLALENIRLDVRPRSGKSTKLDLIDALMHSLQRISALVDNLVELSSSDEVILIPRRARTDVANLARLTAAIYESPDPADPRISVEMPAELWANVDAMLVERILHNVLSNAVRFVGSSDRIVVRGSYTATGDLELAIGNTGAPIPREHIPTLFEKYRIEGEQSRHGLGLYFCRLASEAHGGEIALATHPDFTTYFVIRLPNPPV